MPASLRVLLASALLLSLIGCPTGRRGGGGGGGVDDDDDAASNAEPGLFLWTHQDSNNGYTVARLLLPLETGFTCEDIYGGYYLYDEDDDWIVAIVYRGDGQQWEQEYVNTYLPDCEDPGDDWSELRCFYLFGRSQGDEFYSDAEDTFRIVAYSGSQVTGSLSLDEADYDFSATNCGEATYYDRSEPAAQGAEVPDPTARPSWRLRFR